MKVNLKIYSKVIIVFEDNNKIKYKFKYNIIKNLNKH